MTKPTNRNKRLRKTLYWLGGLVVAMFFFGYAMVPLYDVLCRALGINGKTENASVVNNNQVDKTRTIEVLFVANNNENLPWEFKPMQRIVNVHPGQSIRIAYYAKNDSKKTMTIQAIPSVTPGLAANYFKKTQCFCFDQQTLQPGKSMEMPIVFHIEPGLPKNVKSITLSYTLFDYSKARSGVKFK